MGMDGIFDKKCLLAWKVRLSRGWHYDLTSLSFSPPHSFNLLCFYSFPSVTPPYSLQQPHPSPHLSLLLTVCWIISSSLCNFLSLNLNRLQMTCCQDCFHALYSQNILIYAGENHLENGKATVKMSSMLYKQHGYTE